jgi:hypothetical protein
MFGGSLTIEEFRRGSSNVYVTMPYEHHVMPTITTEFTKRAPKLVETGASTGEELVLKREKPLARTKNTLEASLGIIRKKTR